MMYKPPHSTNRVRTLRNKFENLENNKTESIKINGSGNNLNKYVNKDTLNNEKPNLQRQISDPLKRNIKRTPAFRVDKNVTDNSDFQRNCLNRSTLYENKLKQYNAVKNNCDILNNCVKSGSTSDSDETKMSFVHSFVKSKSSHDFQTICKNFNSAEQQIEKQSSVQSNGVSSKIDHILSKNISMLYTEPIPKALRAKNLVRESQKEKECDIYNIGTLKLEDDNTSKRENLQNTVLSTDTLKTALKKPLPEGPAPKKPPRTFQYIQDNCDMTKNVSFLHLINENGVHSSPKSGQRKTDPKYMLNKLENALRNNKLRARRQYKTDISTTSGEDSDDSLLCKSKSSKLEVKLPSQSADSVNNSSFSFDCLGVLHCSRSEYEKIGGPSSSFFIENPDEPIYVEPYHYLKEDSSNLRTDRNSL